MFRSHVGQNKLNFKKVGMIFDLAENFTNYSWDLLPSFGDNEKSAGPPLGAAQGRIWTLFKLLKKFKLLFLSVSKSDLIQTRTD
jgi:hypothetical protein